MSYKNRQYGKIKTVTAVVVAGLFIAGSLFFKQKVDAQVSGIVPFGGVITYVDYCCDGSVLMWVSPPVPGIYIYSPYVTRMFQNFNIFSPGPWILGNSVPGGFCDLIVAECEFGLVGNTITMEGSSL